MKDFVFVVETHPVPGQEDAYNDWYDNRHIPDVLAVPGVLSARRFAAIDATAPYLALYNIRTGDPAAVLDEIGARAGSEHMPMSPALDMASVRPLLYEAIGDLQMSAEDESER